MSQFTNLSRVMEYGYHFKNEINIENMMNSKSLVKKTFLLFVAFCISAASVFAQDVITLKNGEDIEALVQEIGEVDVKYKKFDNPNGPNYTLKKAEIFMIRYANGSKDVFVDNTTPPPVSVESTKPSTVSAQTTQGQPTTQSQALLQNETPIVALSNGRVGDGYGSKISSTKVRELLSVNPAALATYNRGLSQRRKSNGLAIPGFVFAGAGIILMFTAENAANSDAMYLASLGCMTASLPFLISSTILTYSGNRKVISAVDMYNNSIHKRSQNISLNLGITRSGGIGLALNF
jgi:hypothetical protein